MAQAQLMRRTGPQATPEIIPRDQWSFARCPDGKTMTPSNVDVCLPAGFSTNYIYHLVYEARDPLVMGIGFAATRDLISFLRHDNSAANPLLKRPDNTVAANPIRFAIGFGRSQSGRYMKDLVHLGFNQDEAKRIVFDGIAPLISGSRLTNVNTEFAMPGRFSSPVEGHFYPGDQFPHTYATTTDPISSRTDGWLARCARQGVCPKVMHWDSSIEMWAARSSLVVTDAHGKNTVPIPDNVRLYYFAGTQHVPTLKPDHGICKHLSNPNPYRDGLRALLVAMQEWVSTGKQPPASRFPGLDEGSLVKPSALGFPDIPGVKFTGKHNEMWIRDYGVQPPRNVPGTQYTVLVPKVDADGNETGGVRSVMLQVPLGTYTGWSQRAAGFMEDEFCYLQGAYFPFAKTAAEQGSDPRPSLQERYGSHAGYVTKVEAAARKLVSEGFLLPEDAARIIEEAGQRDLGF